MGEQRVGLVLGAGGVAGGAFHAGFLAALEEQTGWDPRQAHVLVGTSAGSVSAATLRAGLSAADLLARSEGRPLSPEGAALIRPVGPPHRPPSRAPAPRARRPGDLAGALGRVPARPFARRPGALLAALVPDGRLATDPITTAMAALHGTGWPEHPLWICAVRRRDGRRVVFGRDRFGVPVGQAVAASCAIPGYYRPVVIDGEDHLDGGVHSPTNADVLDERDLGLHLVVVSSPMSRRGRRMGLAGGDAVRRWSGAMLDLELRRLRRRGVVVVAVEPSERDLTVMGVNAMDPDRRAPIAIQARRSALEWLSRPEVAARLQVLRT